MNILIVGKAKTGTTIISKSIEKSMPGPKPVYYLEPKTEAEFEPVVSDRAESKVVKIIFEHWADEPDLRRRLERREGDVVFDKVVYIVRDIRDEMISRLLYVVFPLTRKGNATRAQHKRWIAALKAKERQPAAISFLDLCERFATVFGTDFLKGFLANEAQATLDYLDVVESSPYDKCVIKYEDFIAGSLDGLGACLGFPVAIATELDGLDRTRRSQAFDNWKSVFTPADVDFFREALGPQLEKSGYTDWALVPAGRLSPEHYSGYVTRLIRGA